MRRTLLSCLCAIAAGLTTTATAADLLVPSQHRTIQAAIDAAQPGDTVILADGVYSGSGNRDVSFKGKAITVRSANGPAACIVECLGTPEAPARGFQFVSGETADAVLEGITITGGATPPGAIADQFNGGGILVNASSPTIKNCVIRDNNCGCWGGGICCTNASPTIVDCRITGNHADDDGGGIFAWNQSSPKIINTLVANNDTVSLGGGITMFSGTGEIVNSTVVGNTAGSVGGVYSFGSTIQNSIIWGNANLQFSGTDIRYSMVEGGAEGEGNLDVDPLFVDAAAGDYHLASGSPLIDAGNTGLVPAGVTTDFEGDPRVLGSRVDIGADEHRCAGDFDASGDLGFGDLTLLLQKWGPCPGECPFDLDGSNAVGFGDLTMLLTTWGACQ